jgi:hypothetical protein
MSTIRNVANVVRMYPVVVENVRQKIDPLDHEQAVIKAIRWELAKLPDDQAVIRCITYLMDHLGYEQRDTRSFRNEPDEMHQT